MFGFSFFCVFFSFFSLVLPIGRPAVLCLDNGGGFNVVVVSVLGLGLVFVGDGVILFGTVVDTLSGLLNV